MRIFAIIFLSIILMMIPASADTTTNLSENTSLSIVAPYIGQYVYNSPGSGTNDFYGLNYGTCTRVRQNGQIVGAQFALSNTATINRFQICVWRQNDTTGNFTLIDKSEDVSGYITADGIQNVLFSSPLNASEGDFIGWECNASSNVQTTSTSIGSTTDSKIYWGEGTTFNETDMFDFINGSPHTTSNKIFRIGVFMDSVRFAFIGDSVVSGRPAHTSYIDPSTLYQPNSSMAYQFGELTGESYQNLGWRGQSTTEIRDRFVSDAISLHPDVLFIEGGLNDWYTSIPPETTLENICWMANTSSSAGIIVIICEIPPSTGYGDSDNWQDWQDINDQLKTIYENNESITILPIRNYVGEYNASHPDGNLWDIQDAYDSGDKLHYNVDGYIVFAEAVYDCVATLYTGSVCNFYGEAIKNLPTLYTIINNESLLAYDPLNTSYIMQVPFYQNSSSHIFHISDDILFLKSNDDGSPSYYRYAGNTTFLNSNISAFDTSTFSLAPITDTTRASVYSDSGATGDISYCTFNNLGYSASYKYGLTLTGYNNGTIEENTFNTMYRGLYLSGCGNNTISDCEISSTERGLYLNSGCTNNILSNITVTSPNYGTYIGTTCNNNIFNAINTTSTAAYSGLIVYSCSNNTFFDSLALSSGEYGTRLNAAIKCSFYNHSSVGSTNDYAIKAASTDTAVIDSADDVFDVKIEDETSELTIENTDGQLFNETATATAYSYQNGTFQMYETGTIETFTITQYDSFVDSTTANSTVLGVPHATSSINVTSGTLDSWISSGLTPDAYYELLTGGTTLGYIYADIGGNVTVSDDLTTGVYYLTPAVTYNVSGYVFDDSTPATAIEGATVNRAGVQSTTTNATGYYILAVYNSTSTFTANANGYNYNQTDITVDGAPLTDQNFTLTAEQPNYVPLSIYLTTSVLTLVGLFLTIPRRDDWGLDVSLKNIITGVIAAGLSFVLAKVSINGQLVQTFAGVTSADTIAIDNNVIQIAWLGWFWTMVGIIASAVTFYLIMILIKDFSERELEIDFGDDYL